MAELSRSDLSGIERRLNALEQTVAKTASTINANIESVSSQVATTQAELKALKNDFEKMINEQRRTASLQQATTELVSVRQELEAKFGNYRVVRNTMLGILQSTDAALVRKVTVSQVSEELMIATPDYWLAPVLVAVAAWIGNNRDLADRAMREALKRDNEHASLVMALICRRNNRVQTCYEWLARYFSTQNSASFDADDMVYIDAYINGIFGADDKHMCDDFITRWIDEIRGSSSKFEEEQAETWQEYFNRFNVSQANKYPALKACTQEFGYIDQYLSRVDALDGISDNFHKIQEAFVDQDALRKAVDQHLIALVSADDKAERDLREQEEYLIAVKACQGDVETARKMVEKRKREKQKGTMDIVQQLTHIISDDKNVSPSEKKTAVSFLRGYINRGFDKYIDEKKDSFPQQITINVNGWTGQTKDGSNAAELHASYDEFLVGKRAAEAAEAEKKMNAKVRIIAAAILGVVGVLTLPIGILFLAIAAGLFISSFKAKKDRAAALIELDEQYKRISQEGNRIIDDCLSQWNAANGEVENFKSIKPEHIVA